MTVSVVLACAIVRLAFKAREAKEACNGTIAAIAPEVRAIGIHLRD